MRKLLLILILSVLPALAADNAVERWAKAAGGRDKIAAIHTVYREGTLEFAGFQGTIKVWHTADGKYRKEEHVGPFSNIETFDGTSGTVQQGDAPARAMTAEEVALSSSKRFANSNAMFFAFFPERRRGSVALEGDDTIVLKQEGGVEWRVTLDPQTSLPRTMVHQEGAQTITVQFASYETVGGVTLEKEIHRSMTGGPGAVIRFTKTVINPPVTDAMFTGAGK